MDKAFGKIDQKESASHWVKQEFKSSRKVLFTCICGLLFILIGAAFAVLLLLQPDFSGEDDIAIVEEESKISWAENNCNGEYLVGQLLGSIGGKQTSYWNPSVRNPQDEVLVKTCDAEQDLYKILGYKDKESF